MQRSFKTLAEAFSVKKCCPICQRTLKTDFEDAYKKIKIHRIDNKVICSDNELSIQFDLLLNNFSLDEDDSIDYSINHIGSAINGWMITPSLLCVNCFYEIKFESLRFDLSLNKMHKIVLAIESFKVGGYSIFNNFVHEESCHIYKMSESYPLVGKLTSIYNFTDKTSSEIESWIKTVTVFS